MALVPCLSKGCPQLAPCLVRLRRTPRAPPVLPPCPVTSRDGGPWMELCLKSYYGDPAQPWQTRQYRMFGAALQLPPPPAADAG